MPSGHPAMPPMPKPPKMMKMPKAPKMANMPGGMTRLGGMPKISERGVPKRRMGM